MRARRTCSTARQAHVPVTATESPGSDGSDTRLRARDAPEGEPPSADDATWSLVGPRFGVRSGPLDSGLPCQSPEDFARQGMAGLRRSACQRARLDPSRTYLVRVTVMERGNPSVDRAWVAIRGPEPRPPPAAVARRTQRPAEVLDLPERTEEVGRAALLSARFGEHGPLAQSRDFVRTVRLGHAPRAGASAARRGAPFPSRDEDPDEAGQASAGPGERRVKSQDFR